MTLQLVGSPQIEQSWFESWSGAFYCVLEQDALMSQVYRGGWSKKFYMGRLRP